MISYLVLRLGRGPVFALLTAVMILAVSVAALGVARLRPNSISPAEALSAGGHTVVVRAGEDSSMADDISATFQVETLDGRPPRHKSGALADGVAQIVVGPDWIGQVRITYEMWCNNLGWRKKVRQTDLIGEPYGWGVRNLDFRYLCGE